MKPRLLSYCIRRGSDLLPGRTPHQFIDLDAEGSCPLGAAFVGTFQGAMDVQRFFALARNSSRESITEFILVGLYKAHPVVGCDVRVNERLEQYLERERLIPRLREDTPAYTLGAHLSIFGAVALLHDKQGWHKDQVAGLLARCGL